MNITLIVVIIGPSGMLSPQKSELFAPSHYSGGPSVCITSSHVVVPLECSCVSHLVVIPQSRNCVLSISARIKICPHLVISPLPRFYNILSVHYLPLLEETGPDVPPTKLGQPPRLAHTQGLFEAFSSCN